MANLVVPTPMAIMIKAVARNTGLTINLTESGAVE
jgi:hypothetical protein